MAAKDVRFSDGDSVLGDGGGTEALVENGVAALGT